MSHLDDSLRDSRGVMLSSVLCRFAAWKPREEVPMVAAVIAYVFAISFGVVIVWSWVAFISQLVSWHRGTTRTIPYPHDVLWTLTGTTLLDLGFFGGAPVWAQRPQLVLRRLERAGTPRTGPRVTPRRAATAGRRA